MDTVSAADLHHSTDGVNENHDAENGSRTKGFLDAETIGV